MDPIITTGFTIIVIVQGAIFFQQRQSTNQISAEVKKVSDKVDLMVTESQCEERMSKNADQCLERREHIRRDIDHTNTRLSNHCHNGEGVKFSKV